MKVNKITASLIATNYSEDNYYWSNSLSSNARKRIKEEFKKDLVIYQIIKASIFIIIFEYDINMNLTMKLNLVFINGAFTHSFVWRNDISTDKGK